MRHINKVCSTIYADNVTLPAFARRAAVRRAAVDRYLLPAGPPPQQLCCCVPYGTDRQSDNTDRRTPDRCIDSCSAYYAGSANNLRFSFLYITDYNYY